MVSIKKVDNLITICNGVGDCVKVSVYDAEVLHEELDKIIHDFYSNWLEKARGNEGC